MGAGLRRAVEAAKRRNPLMFNRGDKVWKVLAGPPLGGTGEPLTSGRGDGKPSVVCRVTPKSCWLDNGPGNDESGPFDRMSGAYGGPGVPGYRMWIEKVSNGRSGSAAKQ